MSIRARTWCALVVPPLAWFVFEQGLSALLHANCSLWPAGIAWGIASLAACALAARIAWLLQRRSEDGNEPLANPWLARLALVLSCIFALAVAFQSAAVIMVPACVG